MEQTLGKRIMAQRKRLGLTQDQLAEKLGVTAQAVSKWENDQSCPDITMLPKLAEIFGVSTDELLGRQTQPAVHEGEVINEDPENEGIHTPKGNWEFKWASGRREALAYAALVLLFGTLTLLSKILEWEVSWWSILWPSALLVWGLKSLFHRFSFFGLGCAVFGGYFLVENLGIWKLDIGGELVFPIIIVLFGLSLLVDALRKPNKPSFKITHHADGKGRTQNAFSTNGDSFACSLSFGESTRLVSLPRLAGGEASCSFGELTVDLSGCEEVSEDCLLTASCSFGELVFLVPSRYRIDPNPSTAFAEFSCKGQPDPEPVGVIKLDADVSFGEVTIRYI